MDVGRVLERGGFEICLGDSSPFVRYGYEGAALHAGNKVLFVV